MNNLAVFTAIPVSVVGFGKYVVNEAKVDVVTTADGAASKEDNLPSTLVGGREGVAIEIFAAALIALLFGLFILIYVVALQCWWRFAGPSDSKEVNNSTFVVNNVRRLASDGDSVTKSLAWWRHRRRVRRKWRKNGITNENNCVCFAQTAWEPVDLGNYLKDGDAIS